MTDLVRQEIVHQPGVLVVKVGTRVLTQSDGTLDEQRIASLAEDISTQCDQGRQVVLVSSGAVGAGMSQLGLTTRPQDVAQLQAIAAVGQTRLIECYDRIFRTHQRHAGQVLLTAEDLSDRGRYLNVRNTLLSLLDMNVVPIVNENDTVAVDELVTSFGDNDRLAALVANALRAPLLLILSDVEGLFDRSPEQAGAEIIHTVRDLESVRHLAADRASSWSKGGMASKLNAAKIVTAAGENCVIASGNRSQVISDVMDGKVVGTVFLAEGKAVSPRKRWIGFSAQPVGNLVLDDGACAAVCGQGTSLLAAGIRQCVGDFHKGDIVSLFDSSGAEIGRGLTNYDAPQVRQMMGLRTEQIAATLGQLPYTEVVHRNNMQVF